MFAVVVAASKRGDRSTQCCRTVNLCTQICEVYVRVDVSRPACVHNGCATTTGPWPLMISDLDAAHVKQVLYAIHVPDAGP